MRGSLRSFQYLIQIFFIRLQPLLRRESPIHKALFWVAISILQLDESSLYASGLAFLEQNLLTLESHGNFEHDPIDVVMMTTREALGKFANRFFFSSFARIFYLYKYCSATYLDCIYSTN